MSNLQFLAVWSGFVSSDLVKTRQRGMEPQGHRLLGIVSETHFFLMCALCHPFLNASARDAAGALQQLASLGR